ncbi:hypothetical protein B0F90DRAFT_1636470 [Multifurca ochricompacta]|uniref:ubiquitinyl hydrolase 1 n=1 Tax=Multifurca ochricompacta TaxID=376703 RepID=A0AAD4M120_9AGAM|nr:hypothetical protein B0F90DRAFT_1636470 [Multifurca ochricompacta]
MTNNEKRKTPDANVDPVTLQGGVASISPSTFYYGSQGQGQQPPLPPNRPAVAALGSSTTGHYTIQTSEKSPFREPELVPDDSDQLPALDDYQADQDRRPFEYTTPPRETWEPADEGPWPSHSEQYYGSTSSNPFAQTDRWIASGPAPSWGAYDNSWAAGSARRSVPIDGRNETEEMRWWDVQVRGVYARPGHGILPPVLADRLHNPEHTLFSISVQPPDLKPTLPPTPTHSQPAHQAPLYAPSPLNYYPAAEEVRTAVPHPSAYYCRKHNGWVLLVWKSSSVNPPLSRSFNGTLPDHSHRRMTNSCIGDGEQPLGPANVTHHFHAYERAVDARRLTHPFNASEWENEERSKLRNRRVTLRGDDPTPAATVLEQVPADDTRMDTEQEESEGELLDLYVCCQCSFYVIASDVIPGVIPVKLLEDLVKNKMENPPLDRNGELAALITLETILTIIENRVWKGETRQLPVSRKTFQTKLGWNTTLARIFESLGFETRQLVGPVPDVALSPPDIDPTTPAGKLARSKLLRGWVELSAWVADYSKRFAPALRTHVNPHKLWVKIDSAREEYQHAIGAHPDQIARGQLPQILNDYDKIDDAVTNLGLTKTTYSPDLLAFAYFAQARCNPAHTIEYFTSFYTVCQMVTTMTDEPSQTLQSFVFDERERGRFTREDFREAPTVLGFGFHGTLGVEYDDDVPDEFVENAWREAVRRAWREGGDGQHLTMANDAFRRMAEMRGSEALWKKWEQAKDGGMTPERAYSTLEVPAEIDDGMLITIFSMRVEDQPNQVDKMREAISVIAEMRDSERLRKFLETGSDPGETVPTARQDWPRGLNQLGNTCYLNSLLQYFYTIKDLRDAIAPLLNSSGKTMDEEKLTDDDLKRHRVGGRLVTRKEILRSKKFVSELAELFWHLEHADIASVTPTIELAKLALVTSKDEEDDIEQTATDSSNDTDATLVEDAPPRVGPVTGSPVGSPGASSSSVLGKRSRDKEIGSRMSIDSFTDKDNYVIISKSPDAGPSGLGGGSGGDGGATQDVEMKEGEAPAQSGAKPPLPPRKTTESVMMFGRQHDVSECMDNCVFQIETALLKFDGLDESEDGKSSVVKRLFYGTSRQRLVAPTSESARTLSTHETENVFSILPVSVSDEGYDLYDGLNSYFHSTAQLDSDTVSMEITLVDLPPVLQIQLQRVQWDRETGQSWKSQAFVKFGETICMDRFLDSANPDKRARSKTILSELTKCRDRIHLLTTGQHAPFTSALSNTHDVLKNLHETMHLPELDSQLLSDLIAERDYLQDELELLRASAASMKQELEDIWKEEHEAVYELTSVFIHRGSTPQWGHYFFYSRHLPENPDSWFKYNDSEVGVVPKDEVLADTTGSTANPYMLVFVRKGSDMISTVKRFDPMSLEDA